MASVRGASAGTDCQVLQFLVFVLFKQLACKILSDWSHAFQENVTYMDFDQMVDCTALIFRSGDVNDRVTFCG